MKYTTLANIATSLFVLALTACSSSAQGGLPDRSTSAILTNDHAENAASLALGGGDELYISHTIKSNTVQLFNGSSPFDLIGGISNDVSGPTGLAIDTSGNLFVANSSGNVTKYPHGSKYPVATYSSGIVDPFSLAVGPNGTLYVSSYTGPGQPTHLIEYPAGSTKPSLNITLNGGPEGMTVSKDNTLYMAYNYPSANFGTIMRFAPNKTKMEDLHMTMRFAGGIALDRDGNLVASDQSSNTIDVFPLGSHKPSKVVKVVGSNLGSEPAQLVFNALCNKLYVANTIARVVDVYSYPSFKLIHRYPKSEEPPIGVAAYPAARP